MKNQLQNFLSFSNCTGKKLRNGSRFHVLHTVNLQKKKKNSKKSRKNKMRLKKKGNSAHALCKFFSLLNSHFSRKVLQLKIQKDMRKELLDEKRPGKNLNR